MLVLVNIFQLAPQFFITKGLLWRKAMVAFGHLHKDQKTESLRPVSRVHGRTGGGLEVW